MKRYQKANEGVHAPNELKKRAAESARMGRRIHWAGPVAAVLSIAILGGVALRPWTWGTADNPMPGILPVARAAVLAEAEYPEMAPYPKDEDYFNEHGMGDYDAWSEAWDVWRKSMDTFAVNTDFHELDDFIATSTAQFLTGAGKENRVYSPLNVYMALAMLAETAGGDSRQQILDLLGEDSIEALRASAAALWRSNYRDDGVVTSIMANSLWLRNDMTYSQEVLDTLANTYYASAFSGEMGTPEYTAALRDWLNEQTKGLLTEQVSELNLHPSTVMALASTLYFKAGWNNEFNETLTETAVFHTPSGDADVEFMHQTTLATYYWGEHFAAVSLHFQQGGDMWLILPDEGYSADQLLESGEAMDFLLQRPADGKKATVYSFQKYLKVNLSLPKFDASSDLDLIEGLKKLGVTDVFDMHAADFTPLAADTDDPLYINKAEHAARVRIDEEGCEAAAYTVLLLYAGSAAPPDEEVDFTLDRPFLFAVTGDSGLPLFVGVVNQP